MSMKITPTLIILTILLFGCSKSSNVTLNGKLTDCPANNTCTYDYYENADFTTIINQTGTGGYRIFVYESDNKSVCDATISLNFKTAMSANEFTINADQIAAGQIVKYGFSCTCCDYTLFSVNPQPIGGKIQGKKAGNDTWLINASIIMGTAPNKPTDTLVVNQYFTTPFTTKL